MVPRVDEDKCVGCGACVNACPANPCVFELAGTAQVVNSETCTGCGQCIEACPVEAIELIEQP